MRLHPEPGRSTQRSTGRIAPWLAALALLAAGGASAASEERDESKRWVPSFSVYFDMLGQKAAGSVTTGPVLGPPLSPFDTEEDAILPEDGCLVTSTPPIGPPVTSRSGALCQSERRNPEKILADSEDDDTSVVPLVGASIELMTPSLIDGFLRPRLFVHGDLAAAFAFERNLAGIESPDEFQLPAGLPANQTDVEELSIRGQGSRTRIQVQRLVYSAGGGIAFSFDLFERRVRLKPSIEYLRYDLDLIGVVHRAVKRRQPSNPSPSSGLDSFRLISLTRVEEQSYEGIGPGLELEVDTSRVGPFLLSVYLMGRGYRLFGELDSGFTQTNEFGETASWTFEPERWVWRSGIGFRFRWVPESD